jgi:serine/threonine-protein kinase
MGVVYKVEHVRIGKLLAMKLLAGHLAGDPDVIRRFNREALTVSRLQSPNAVQVLDYGVWAGFTYLVMELIVGESLGKFLRCGGKVGVSRFGKIMVQVCAALAEAHQKGIVHRDIKPDNVMILPAPDGTDLVKVLDFGLAKLRDAEPADEITEHGTVLGTPYYMAPEQIRAEEIDARTDVYAAGALMYRLLTGHHLFDGPPMLVMSCQLTEVPIAPIDRAPDRAIPPGVSRLVMKALAKDPIERFQSAEELGAAVAREVEAAGSSSVHRFLDPVRVQSLADRALRTPLPGAPALATRDDVDAYERGLRRRRFGLIGFGAALAVLAAAGVAYAAFSPPRFDGLEVEPNDTPAQATPLPLGRVVSGRLGARIDPATSDRDFYSFDVAAARPFVRLRLGALPTMSTCAVLYRQGLAQPAGRYCSGRAGLDLSVPILSLEPGHYFLAVMQDMDGHGGEAPFVQEDVSDWYSLAVDPTVPQNGEEVEPNDDLAHASILKPSAPVRATIGWAKDVDHFCVDPAVTEPIRWRITTAADGEIEASILLDAVEVASTSILGGGDRTADYAAGTSRCLRVSGASPAPYEVEIETSR